MKYKAFNNKQYYLAVFNSKNHAILLYYKLEKKGYNNFLLVSTPCKIKGGCSYSIKFNNLKDLEQLKVEANNYKTPIGSIYFVERKDGKNHIKEIEEII